MFIPAFAFVTVPDPDRARDSPETMFPNVEISELETVVFPSKALIPSKLRILLLILIVTFPKE